MDYFNSTTNATVSLAVIRQPAKVPVTDPRYGGAVIVNPGGPGGSGVQLVFAGGSEISAVIDSDRKDGKVYDVLSFDPRGIGRSTPAVSCFENSAEAQSWQLRLGEQGLLGVSDASLGRLWSMSRADGGSCTLPPEDGGPDIKKYVTTASVASDMVSLVEAHGEWREREARKELQALDTQAIVPQALQHKSGKEKIQYWGFSYGTYLGMTFASMFPDRVHRLIADGVVDPVDYAKALWYDNLVDSVRHRTSLQVRSDKLTPMRALGERHAHILLKLCTSGLP
jgi:pimeloyl-ACP methyl ester carboxylesterase